MVDHVRNWTVKSEITQTQILIWLSLWLSALSEWTRSYGKAYEHNGWLATDTGWRAGKAGDLKYHYEHLLNGIPFKATEKVFVSDGSTTIESLQAVRFSH